MIITARVSVKIHFQLKRIINKLISVMTFQTRRRTTPKEKEARRRKRAFRRDRYWC